ncbi:hypothetical protein Tco_1372063, partial [Tanacetum coccineum]
MPSFPSPKPTVSYFNNLDFLKDFKKEFPAIAYNDVPTEPTISPQHIDEFDLKDKTSLSKYDEEEQKVLYFNDLFPFNIIYPDDLKSDKDNDDNEINIIQSSGGGNLYVPFGIPFDPSGFIRMSFKRGSCGDQDMALPPRYQRHQYLRFEGLGYTNADIIDFEERLGRIYGREIHQGVFTSQAWRMLFEIRGPLVHKLILEFFSTFRFGEAMLDLDTAGALQFQLGVIESVGFGAYWAESARQILDKGDLSAYWVGILSVGDFLGTTPSYTSIRDPMLRLYLRLFTSGRKRGAMISGGHFIARLAEHFGLLIEERLQGLTICEELDDTWAWVASGPERQQVAAAGAPVVAKDDPVVDEGVSAVPAPVQAPQAPPAAGPARTMTHRLARQEEDVHGMRGALGEQREVLDSMARDFSRLTTWTVTGLSRMMDQAGVRCAAINLDPNLSTIT